MCVHPAQRQAPARPPPNHHTVDGSDSLAPRRRDSNPQWRGHWQSRTAFRIRGRKAFRQTPYDRSGSVQQCPASRLLQPHCQRIAGRQSRNGTMYRMADRMTSGKAEIDLVQTGAAILACKRRRPRHRAVSSAAEDRVAVRKGMRQEGATGSTASRGGSSKRVRVRVCRARVMAT